MATLTINTYAFTITKDAPDTYTLVAPSNISGTTSPTYTQYSVSSTGALTAGTVTNLSAGNQSNTFVLAEGLHLLLFQGFHGSNRYWIVLGSYQDLLDCLLQIDTNLICSNLCDNCYPKYKQDVVILFSALRYLKALEYYWINPATVTSVATNLSGIPAYANDIVLANKLFTRLATYCSNCLDSPCDDC